MSVEELVLKGLGPNTLKVKEKLFDDSGNLCKDEYELQIWNDKLQRGMPVVLDRNQAHLLMLYLQEHLGKSTITKGIDNAISDELAKPFKGIM